MMTNRKPLIIGHSHIRALGAPLEVEDEETKIAPIVASWSSGGIDDRFECVTGKWPRDRSYYDELVKISARRTVFICWEGNQHLADFLFECPIQFDFMLSQRPDLPTDSRTILLPEALVTEYFRSDSGLDELLSRLKAAPNCRPILIGTPPPKKDDKFLLDIMLTEAHWKKVADLRSIDIASAKLSPPVLRLKMWIVLQNLLIEASSRNNIPFVPVPETVQTSDGFLSEEYYGIDATHAGGEYGAVFRDHLSAKFLF